MAHLSLSLLGTFHVDLDGKPVDGFRSDKARALLAYLAVEARPHSRAHLAGLLWPEWPEATARTYLRQALANMRQILGDRKATIPFLLATPQTIQFNRHSDHRLDVTELEEALAALGAVPVDASTSPWAEPGAVLRLYPGDFLDGFFLNGCEAYEEWQLLMRQRIQQRVADALRQLVTVCEQRADADAAMQYAQWWIELAPWQDEAHRTVMHLWASAGERRAALAHYEKYRQNSEAQWSVAPAPETAQLYECIKAGEYPPLPAPPERADGGLVPGKPTHSLPSFVTQAPLEAPDRSPFVARQREIASLEAHLTRALSGAGHMVFVAGDAGSGKTTLLREWMRLAQAQHGTLLVASGNCSAYTGMGDPYLPFREILGVLTGDVEARWHAGGITHQQITRLWSALPLVLESVATKGLHLVNALLHGDALMARSTQLGAPQEAWREQITRAMQAADTGAMLRQIDLFDQVTAVLRQIAHAHPLLLVVDDLQWADPGSIGLLFHLGRRLAGTPILVIGAYRPEELAAGRNGERHPLEPLLNEFSLLWGDVVVDLNAADGRQFVDALLNREQNKLDDPFRETFFLRCGGHALFATELLDGLQRRRGIVQDRAGYWVATEALDWETTPARIDAVIAERVSRLAQELRQILTVASVQGETFSADIVAELLHRNERELVQLLSEQLDRKHHLVRSQSAQRVEGRLNAQYQFRHILFQEFLYNTLDVVERTYWHDAIAQALERRYSGMAEARTRYATQLARHFQLAGDTGKAVLYFIRAGTGSMRLFANEEAIAHYTEALSLLNTMPETTESLRQELHIQAQLGIAAGLIHGHAAAITEQYLVRAQTLASQLNDDAECFRAAWRLWQFSHVRGELYAAQERGQHLLRQALQSADEMQIIAAQQALGTTVLALGELSDTRTYLTRSLGPLTPQQQQEYIREYGTHPGTLSQLFLAITTCCMGYPARATQHSQEALRVAKQVDHPFSISFALVAAFGVHLMRREPAIALHYSNEALSFCREHAIHQWIPWAHHARGVSLSMLGQPAEGLREAAEGFAAWQESGSYLWSARLGAILADAYLQAENLSDANRFITEALEHVERTGERLYEAELYRLQGESLLRQNQRGTAKVAPAIIESHFQRSIDVAQQQQAKLWELRAAVSLSRLWIRIDRLADARALLRRVYNWFAEGFDAPDLNEANVLLEQLEKRNFSP